MKVEILITADVIEYPEDNIETLKKEIANSIRIELYDLKVFDVGEYLKNIDHELAFEDEGEYVWKKGSD
uniref:Uncharacterized protein n=1 Tax=viral metagenome TaxID=1070528 RepID=A0A6M3LVY6_9ZZZZ